MNSLMSIRGVAQDRQLMHNRTEGIRSTTSGTFEVNRMAKTVCGARLVAVRNPFEKALIRDEESMFTYLHKSSATVVVCASRLFLETPSEPNRIGPTLHEILNDRGENGAHRWLTTS